MAPFLKRPSQNDVCEREAYSALTLCSLQVLYTSWDRSSSTCRSTPKLPALWCSFNSNPMSSHTGFFPFYIKQVMISHARGAPLHHRFALLFTTATFAPRAGRTVHSAGRYPAISFVLCTTGALPHILFAGPAGLSPSHLPPHNGAIPPQTGLEGLGALPPLPT